VRRDSTRGIRAHVNRFSHNVINVSDLDRSVEFYEATFPVRRRCRIDGPAQAYPSLGIENGQLRGWVLESRSNAWPPGELTAEHRPRELHLIQWLSPGPTGKPYREANNLGIYRQNSLVGDLDRAYQTVLDHGGRPYGPPAPILLTPEGLQVRTYGYRDPDGITLQMMGPDTPDPDYPGAIYHCNINVSDLNAANRFYRDVLGLDHIIYLEPGKSQPMANGNLGDAMLMPDGSQYGGTDMDFKAVFLGIRSDSRTPVDLVQWKLPGYGGRPYEAANNLGIVRVAIEVDDLDAAHAKLKSLIGDSLSDIETWDMGEFGVHRIAIFRDPDGTTLELIEQPESPGNPTPPDFG
jgi:catechol 2,3-dioxygenase-like lactoylglutathione lyase family enzyme